MRRAVAFGFIAIGLALVIGLLLAPNTRVVRLPPPTPGVPTAPTPTAPPPVRHGDQHENGPSAPHPTDIGDYDCGPECYKEDLDPDVQR
jgi:hypothetical protein